MSPLKLSRGVKGVGWWSRAYFSLKPGKNSDLKPGRRGVDGMFTGPLAARELCAVKTDPWLALLALPPPAAPPPPLQTPPCPTDMTGMMRIVGFCFKPGQMRTIKNSSFQNLQPVNEHRNLVSSLRMHPPPSASLLRWLKSSLSTSKSTYTSFKPCAIFSSYQSSSAAQI